MFSCGSVTGERYGPRMPAGFPLIWPKLGHIALGPIACKRNRISMTAWMQQGPSWVLRWDRLHVGEAGTISDRLQAGHKGSSQKLGHRRGVHDPMVSRPTSLLFVKSPSTDLL